MDRKKKEKLEDIARTLRIDILKMLCSAGSGHSAGPLGLAEVFSMLYFHIMRYDPSNPEWEDRDRLILSNGHVCPILYASLARAGFFPVSELSTLRKLGSRLQGHPHLGELPGVENTSGPLGQGLSFATGIAIAGKREKKPYRVFCVVSDGEFDEGQTWEAMLLASKMKLDNLVAIMDRNRIQIDGTTEEVLPLEPLKEKCISFGWNAEMADGNSIEELSKAFSSALSKKGMPSIIIAETVPGKGVDFMEGDYRWHGKPPNKEELERALKCIQREKNG